MKAILFSRSHFKLNLALHFVYQHRIIIEDARFDHFRYAKTLDHPQMHIFKISGWNSNSNLYFSLTHILQSPVNSNQARVYFQGKQKNPSLLKHKTPTTLKQKRSANRGNSNALSRQCSSLIHHQAQVKSYALQLNSHLKYSSWQTQP